MQTQAKLETQEKKYTLIAQSLVGSLILFIYLPVFTYLFRMWSTDEYSSHGWLIIPISAFIIFMKRNRLKLLPCESSITGLFILILGLLFYLANVFADVDFMQAISLIIVLYGLTLYLFGKRISRELLFPIAFLIFMVPMPEMLISVVSFPMQLLSSIYATMTTGILGIPVERDGVNIYLTNFSFEVAAPCSGLKSTVALLALAAIFAYLVKSSPIKKITLFIAALPIALMANIVRITCVLLIAHFFGGKAAMGFFHGFSGIVLFGFAFLGLTLVGRLLQCHIASPIIG